MSGPARLGVLLSGGGTTLENIYEVIGQGDLDAEVALVVSSRPQVGGLERARRRGTPHLVVEHDGDDASFSGTIATALREARVDLVVLAGFMRFWDIPEDFRGRVLNIHPALLPLHGGPGCYGKRVHQQVLDAGDDESGCTVHFADNIYDHGPVILQRRIPVLPGDTAESLAKRVFVEECLAYPEAIRRVLAGDAAAN